VSKFSRFSEQPSFIPSWSGGAEPLW